MDEHLKKRERINFYCTKQEKELWIEESKRMGKTLSEYLRYAANSFTTAMQKARNKRK